MMIRSPNHMTTYNTVCYMREVLEVFTYRRKSLHLYSSKRTELIDSSFDNYDKIFRIC